MTLSRATKKTGESGFSLISVIIAVGLSAVVSLSLGSFFLNMIRSQKTITLEGEIIQLMDDVKRSLIRSTACIDSIATASSAKGSVSSLPIKLKSILDENGQTVATLGKIPGSNLNIQSININLSKSAPTLLADTLQTAELSIIFDDGATYRSPKIWRRKTNLTLQTDSSSKIIGCNTLSMVDRVNFEKGLCKTLGGNIKSNKICDLTKSPSLTKAVCSSLGLRSKGEYCE